MTSTLVLENGQLLAPGEEALQPATQIVIEGNTIKEVTQEPVKGNGFERVDLAGRTVMPGLIDAHVHVTVAKINIGDIANAPATLTAIRAAEIMRGMLSRGFTTVRDAGGADFGLAQAVRDRLLPGPSVFYSGKALSQTGGHGDFRPQVWSGDGCPCSSMAIEFSAIVDGVSEVQRAAREELRKGATQIKIMASGGVASPTDPVWNLQFSDDEIRAVVWEASAWRTYVMAHAYTPEAVSRAIRLGVRSIEHGNLIDEASARLMVEHDAFLVPTLSTYEALYREGREFGFPDVSLAKLADVRDAGLRALEIAQRSGVKIAFGTDLLGPTHHHQSNEFVIRREIQSNVDIIRSATTTAAELLNRTGQLGELTAGANADLLIVDGDPHRDIEVLVGQGERIPGIMRDGRFFKREL